MDSNLTEIQSDYARFLPAVSGFYATFIGKQRYEEYVEYNRVPKHFANGVESLNFFLNILENTCYDFGLSTFDSKRF